MPPSLDPKAKAAAKKAEKGIFFFFFSKILNTDVAHPEFQVTF